MHNIVNGSANSAYAPIKNLKKASPLAQQKYGSLQNLLSLNSETQPHQKTPNKIEKTPQNVFKK